MERGTKASARHAPRGRALHDLAGTGAVLKNQQAEN